MVGVACGDDGPELMSDYLLIGFLLPSLEDLAVEELLRVFIFDCNVHDELRIDHNSP